jgi:alkaline phosphatase D
MTNLEDRAFDRRGFLRRGAITAGGFAVASLAVGKTPIAGALTTAHLTFGTATTNRPVVTNGVQSGDVTFDRAIVWARADRPSRLVVEVSTTDSFRDRRVYEGAIATADSDFTAKARLEDLDPGQRYSYRVTFEDLSRSRTRSEPVMGTFSTPSRRARDVRFAWTGDQAGQGWGINPDIGGMPCWETIRHAEPQFLVHSGDTIYADVPLVSSVTLPDGTIWHNIVTPEKSKVAETLDEFRGNYRYNLLDDNVRGCLADVPMIVQWDDHEVANNWYPGEQLDYRPEYTVQDVNTLAARSSRAFHEYMPIGRTVENVGRIYRKISRGPLLDIFVVDMRTFRGANSADRQSSAGPDTAFLGAMQARWLVDQLATSTATWKVVAADMPLGLVVPDPEPDRPLKFEAIAQGDNGVPLGRELETAWVLNQLKRRRVHNVVWLTADVHYCASHFYDPAAAQFGEFDPFWEFVSGPVHAGTFGPNALDATFGPTAVFQKPALFANMAPNAGFQFFGVVDIDARTRHLTVRHVDTTGTTLSTQELAPTH